MMTQKEKLLHHIAAKYIVSEDVDIELSGRPAEMDCLVSLLEVSKRLKIQLDQGATLKAVNKTLKEKIAYEAQNLNMLKEKVAKLPF